MAIGDTPKRLPNIAEFSQIGVGWNNLSRIRMQKQILRKRVSRKRLMEKQILAPVDDPTLFINRELSWLEFNQRVLEEGYDPKNPLLERVKFLCIVSSNLDEFFEVRVAGLKQQRLSNVSAPGPDALSPSEQLAAISVRVRKMVDDQYRLWNDDLVPNLEQNNIFFLRYDE